VCRRTRAGGSRAGLGVALPWTLKRPAVRGDWSVLSLTTFRWPAGSTASRSTTGVTILHGPRHGAQKSTSTGTETRTSSSKVASLASTTHGSAWWHATARNPSRAA
jgi:hypothetical protein